MHLESEMEGATALSTTTGTSNIEAAGRACGVRPAITRSQSDEATSSDIKVDADSALGTVRPNPHSI